MSYFACWTFEHLYISLFNSASSWASCSDHSWPLRPGQEGWLGGDGLRLFLGRLPQEGVMSEWVLSCQAAPFLRLWLEGAGFGCSVSCLCHWHRQVASFRSSRSGAGAGRKPGHSHLAAPCFPGPWEASRLHLSVSVLNTSRASSSALLSGRKRGTLIYSIFPGVGDPLFKRLN